MISTQSFARTAAAAGIAAAVSMSMVACSGGQDSAGDENTIDIAYSVDVLDSTQNIVLEAMQAEVDRINGEGGMTVNLSVYDAQSSVDKQLSDVQTALVQQPDVLILSSVDPQGSLPAAQDAQSDGVRVIDKRPSDPEPDAYDVAFYSNDEERYSQATRQWVLDYLDANPGQTLRVGLIYGAPAQTAQLVREDVLKDLAEEMPDRVQIVAEGYGNWLTETAQNLTGDFLQANPDINYISAANDIMALGAANAIESAGRTGEVLLSGYDLTEDGIQRLRDGTQSFDAGVSLTDSGAQLVQLAVDLAQGDYTDSTYYVDPVYSVTPDNVDSIDALG